MEEVFLKKLFGLLAPTLPTNTTKKGGKKKGIIF
jgi:hypothetical protein